MQGAEGGHAEDSLGAGSVRTLDLTEDAGEFGGFEQFLATRFEVRHHLGKQGIGGDEALQVGPAGLGVDEAGADLEHLADVVGTIGSFEALGGDDGEEAVAHAALATRRRVWAFVA